MITAKQIKAARMLTSWGQQELADACGLSKTAIANIEKETNRPSAANAEKIRDAFDRAGVEFIDGGVREKRDIVQVLEGDDGIRKFYDGVYYEILAGEQDFLVYSVDEKKFTDAALRAGVNDIYRQRFLEALGERRFKVIIAENDKNQFKADHCDYRCLPDEMVFSDAPYYIFGKKIAFFLWRKNSENKVIIINEPDLTEAFKIQYGFIWNIAKEVK